MVFLSEDRNGDCFSGVGVRLLIRVLVVGCLAQLGGCNQSAPAEPRREIVRFEGRTMGTTYGVRGWFRESSGTERVDPDTLQQDVDRLLEEINSQMSTYLSNSELSRFNTAPADRWFSVSPETAFVVDQALKYHQESGGTLDVTIGPLLRLWGFGPQASERPQDSHPPDSERLQAVLDRVGSRHLRVRTDPPALQKRVEGVEIDLSSLAKGYAVDRVVELLRRQGAEGVMVEIGGEVRTLGSRVDGLPWRIGIENPLAQGRQVFRVVPLRNVALATSGDYRHFQQFQGEIVCHLIDPRTGRPLPAQGASVTVCAASCLEADALATALFLMGADRGVTWCEQNEVAALFLTLEDGKVVEHLTPRFQQYVQ